MQDSVNYRQKITTRMSTFAANKQATEVRYSKHFIINQTERRQGKQTVLLDFDSICYISQGNASYSNPAAIQIITETSDR